MKDGGKLVGYCSIALVVFSTAVNAWLGRFEMNSDGLAYLDHAVNAVAQGPSALVSDYWSPAYPSLLTVLLWLLRPAPEWTFPVVHLATFISHLCALACFLPLMRCLQPASVSRLSWLLFSLGLFVWGENTITIVSKAEPDYLAAAAFFLSSALVWRATEKPGDWRRWLAAGVALGLGYLCKFVLFPLSIALFVGLAAGWRRYTRRGVLVALAGFLAVSSPWIYLLSTRLESGFTVGRAGGLNFTYATHGENERLASGIVPLVGRFERLNEKPVVLHFGASAPGTYPLWYEPAYWTRPSRPSTVAQPGTVAPPVSVPVPPQGRPPTLGRLMHRVQQRLLFTGGQYRAILRSAASVFAAMALLCWYAGEVGRRRAWQWLLSNYWLPGWALIGMAGYGTTWVEGRYVGPLLILLMLSVMAALLAVNWQAGGDDTTAPGVPSARLPVAAVLAMAAFTLAAPALFDLPGQVAAAVRSLRRSNPVGENMHYSAARWLMNAGSLAAGDTVGVIGSPFNAYFLQPAGLRAGLETPRGQIVAYCNLDPAGRRRIRELMRSAGAKAILAEDFCPCLGEPGWRRIPGTSYIALMQEPPVEPTPSAGGGLR